MTSSELRISRLELQSSDGLESIADVDIRTIRALGLISIIDGGLTLDHNDGFDDRVLDFDRVCERIDEINNEGELLIAQDMNGGRIVGSMQASFAPTLSSYMVDYLVVDRERRRAGIGRELMNEAELRASQRLLANVSLMAVDESIDFYTRIGYEIDPRRQKAAGYYTPMISPLLPR